jgi:hypothetical protein
MEEVVHESPSSDFMIIERKDIRDSKRYEVVPKNYFELDVYGKREHIGKWKTLADAKKMYKKHSNLSAVELTQLDTFIVTAGEGNQTVYRVHSRGKEVGEFATEEAARAKVEALLRLATKRDEKRASAN